jgi:parallel beta-helix repeat protein
VVASLAVPAISLLSVGQVSALAPRAPIYIDGNGGFIPANGVTSGSGTENDPYIIENWEISAENAHGIEIRNTTAHFTIRNCYVHDGGGNYHGIYFYNVVNGKIDNVTSDNNDHGIYLEDSDNNLIENSTAISNNDDGIWLWRSDSNLVTNNLVENNRSDGIVLSYSSNNLVTNNLVQNNYEGIYLGGSDNNLLSNNPVQNNRWTGISLWDSDNNLISSNQVENNVYGIYLYYSDNNLIKNSTALSNEASGIVVTDNSDNNLIDNCTALSNEASGIVVYDYSYNNVIRSCVVENNLYCGILFSNSSNSRLRNNTLSNNKYNLDVWGDMISHFYHDIDNSNEINGRPIYYVVERENLTFDGSVMDIGYLGLISCENILAKDLNIGNSGRGILLVNTSHSMITNSVFENNMFGIFLYHSSLGNNTVSNCRVEKNEFVGINLMHSSNNRIVDSIASGNSWAGIALWNSDNNVIENCIGENVFWPFFTRHGIYLSSSDNNLIKNSTASHSIWHGIYLSSSDNNTIQNSIASHNHSKGIFLDNSDNNVIKNCTVESNSYGIYLGGSRGNTLYHNNIVNNTSQAFDDNVNTWDAGYPSGGNYWSDYTGVDENHGENQDLPGPDGIGDTPYVIPGDANRDRYPLILILRGVKVSISPSYQSGAPCTWLEYQVTVTNTGTENDSFDLAVSDNAVPSWNPTLVDNKLDNVPPGENRTTTLRVHVSENAENCTNNVLTVTAISQSDPGVSDSDSCIAHAVVVVVRGVDVSIEPSYQSGAPCTWLEYTVTVTNTGTENDDFDLSVSDNAIPSWNPVLDENVFENVPPGENRVTILRVHVSDNALPCTQDNILVTVISQADPSVSDSASCIAHAVAPVDNVPPIIENALAIPDMIALMVEDTGPLRTKLIVDARDVESGIESVTENLRPLFERMFADVEFDNEQAWRELLVDIENVPMNYDNAFGLWYFDFYSWMPLDNLWQRGLIKDNEEEREIMSERIRLGDFFIPVTVRDLAGNENIATLELAIVDTMVPLRQGWNLRSTPVVLEDSRWGAIASLGRGDSLAYDVTIRYNAEQRRWEQYAVVGSVAGWYHNSGYVGPALLEPLEAIYIHATARDQLGLIFRRALYSTGQPSRQLYAGWNLVGLARMPWEPSMPMKEALESVELTSSGLRGYVQVVSPPEYLDYIEKYHYGGWSFDNYWWEFHQDQWTYPPSAMSQMRNLGGYWVFMENPDELTGFSRVPIWYGRP